MQPGSGETAWRRTSCRYQWCGKTVALRHYNIWWDPDRFYLAGSKWRRADTICPESGWRSCKCCSCGGKTWWTYRFYREGRKGYAWRVFEICAGKRKRGNGRNASGWKIFYDSCVCKYWWEWRENIFFCKKTGSRYQNGKRRNRCWYSG